ncbi:MAG TPA: uracil phosphoribosyltransferase [Bacillota bacterium]|nr:uracil phosphoribosyltransferase [Bacillota bacterium]
MSNVFVLDHPLIQHKITYIRDKNTGTKHFRELVDEVAMLMAFEITRNLPVRDTTIETPLTETTSKVLDGKKIGLIPILRAGLGMVDGMLNLLPAAKVGHVGLYRDPETLKPVEYYIKLPSDISERELIVMDPMLATGGSANDAIYSLKKRGAKKIRLMCLVAAPEGIKVIQDNHPDVDIYLGALDEKLDEKGFIVPGLGDAGDRLYGTK